MPTSAKPAPDNPAIVLTERVNNRQAVVACCPLAQRAGVSGGMSLSHARALLTGRPAIIEPIQPGSDRRRLDALAQWALHFSPLVQVDANCSSGQGGLLIDIAGCERLFGGERNLLTQVRKAARRLGLQARLAAADTVGCAWALSHYAKADLVQVSPQRQGEALATLPAAALRLEPSTVAELATVGLTQVGQLLALPRAALVQRFGPSIALRLDQAMGAVWEGIAWVEPETVPQAELVLGGPVRDLNAIQLGVRNLLEKLAAELELQQLGVAQLELRLQRSDAEPVTLTLELSYPTGDAKHLWTLIRPSLERANMGFGVEALRISAVRTAPRSWQQLPLLPEALPETRTAGSRQVGELVDVLSSRLGAAAVSVLEPVESHVPEQAFVRIQAREGLRQLRRPKASARKTPADVEGPDRPSVLLEKPEPVSVTALSPDGPVAGFIWRGKQRQVLTCVGPERIAAAWWKVTDFRHTRPRRNDPLSTRDYYKLQDQHGQWIWLYRQRRDNSWFVHGFWQ